MTERTAPIPASLPALRSPVAESLKAVAPAVLLAGALTVHELVPSLQPARTAAFSTVLAALLGGYVLFLTAGAWRPGLVSRFAPLIAAGAAIVLTWDVLTAKTALLPPPYFPTFDKIVGAFVGDWQLLGLSSLHSLRLLATGYGLGASVGFVSGILMGTTKRGNYWITPLMRAIGPVPATAWIPIAMTLLPSSFWASVFLLALAVWFPVTIMTGSGISNVPNSYFEVARTLGADERYLVRKVAVPAAFPMIFIGLFMGLTMSFITLIVAEMLGVKAGLGWYINWAQGFAEYGKVYASLLIIAVIFSSIITALFKMKDRILVWQRGLIKW